MPLTDMQCRTAKPRIKPYKLFDGDGLYLHVMPTGAKYWRFKYNLYDKEKLMSLGVYPEVSLLQARNKRIEARGTVRQGLDPALVRLEQQQIASFAQSQILEKMAMEWHKQQIGH